MTRGRGALHPWALQSTPTRPLRRTSILALTPRGRPSHLPTLSCPRVRPNNDISLPLSDSALAFDQVLMRMTSQTVGGRVARQKSVNARVMATWVLHCRYCRVRLWRVHQGLEPVRISPCSVLRMHHCRRTIQQSQRRRHCVNVLSQNCLRRRRERKGRRLGCSTGNRGWQKQKDYWNENERQLDRERQSERV